MNSDRDKTKNYVEVVVNFLNYCKGDAYTWDLAKLIEIVAQSEVGIIPPQVATSIALAEEDAIWDAVRSDNSDFVLNHITKKLNEFKRDGYFACPYCKRSNLEYNKFTLDDSKASVTCMSCLQEFRASEYKIIKLEEEEEKDLISPEAMQFLQNVYEFMYLASTDIDSLSLIALVEVITEDHVSVDSYQVTPEDLSFINDAVSLDNWDDFLRKVQEVSERPYDLPQTSGRWIANG